MIIADMLDKIMDDPADFLNEGRYVVGINASTYQIKRYFQDEQTLTFTIDPSGAPGMQWAEPRLGPVRPRLGWQITSSGGSDG